MERKIAMSNTTNEQDRKEFSFEENFIDETIIADKSSKTKEFIKKFMKRKAPAPPIFLEPTITAAIS